MRQGWILQVTLDLPVPLPFNGVSASIHCCCCLTHALLKRFFRYTASLSLYSTCFIMTRYSLTLAAFIITAALTITLSSSAIAQNSTGSGKAGEPETASGKATPTVYESGGPLHPYQAAYDVHKYVLDLQIDPETQTVKGFGETHAEIVQPTNTLRLALDPRFEVTAIVEMMHSMPAPARAGQGMGQGAGAGAQADGEHHPGSRHMMRNGERVMELRAWSRPSADSKYMEIEFPRTLKVGEHIALRISYQGAPRVAPRAPWDGGFTWAQTPSGKHWVAVSCQGDGAWLWWPNKDHPSDEARGTELRFTMPADLSVASNGVLDSVTESTMSDGTPARTWVWKVSNPINTYTVTVNAAPYIELSDEYVSVAGDTMPIQFWVLPEFEEKGRWLFPQFAQQIRFLEETIGPYPFRNEKYGVAHAPFLGMEHQTLIAYGATFSNDNMFRQDVGYDDLHQHELAHEWWGNLVTVWDWRDFWIHEGFGTYMQPLYSEHLQGEEGYRRTMHLLRMRIVSTQEMVPSGFQTTKQVYGTGRGGDIYYKGAWVLHTLRWVVGDDVFFDILRTFAYPTEQARTATDGSQTRFVTSRDFIELAKQKSGLDLEDFFTLYLHRAELPELSMTRDGRNVTLQWIVPEGLDFSVPVELVINGTAQKVQVGTQPVSVRVPRNAEVQADPLNRVLRTEPTMPER